MSSRDKMLAKVRAILAKTLENGCTEGEAMAALAKAQELMAAYDISDVDLNVTAAQEAATVFKTSRDDPYDIKRGLAVAVARFTRCKAWSGKAAGYAIGFAGLESDVIFADWLLSTLQAYVMRALKEHQALRRDMGVTNPRIIGSSFVTGCCRRISERLIELASQATPSVSPTPERNALVVSRNALITEAMAKAGINLRSSRARQRQRYVNQEAYGAGTNAGNGARFDKPVSQGGALLLK